MSKVAVIGGGPAGLLAARELSKRGIEVSVYEEDPEVGKPERCAGLLSLRGLNLIMAPRPRKYILNMVRGAVFHSPSGRIFELKLDRDVAAVISREVFDKMLAEEVLKNGGNILYQTRIRDARSLGDHFTLNSEKYDWIIDAEGMGSRLAQKVLRKIPERSKWIPIIQLTVRNHGMDRGLVHLYFKEYLPDFFAYLIPINEEVGRLGVAARQGIIFRLNKFLSEEFPRVKTLKQISHAIYTGKPLRIDLGKRFIPIGDAAGHVKATTGGGVIMGGLIAINVASALAELELGGNPEKYVKKAEEIYRELRSIARLRRILELIPMKFYDGIFQVLGSSVKDELRKIGDMDFQSSSLRKIILSPRTLLKILRSILI